MTSDTNITVRIILMVIVRGFGSSIIKLSNQVFTYLTTNTPARPNKIPFCRQIRPLILNNLSE